jgi:type IV pilus assembly protein PilC
VPLFDYAGQTSTGALFQGTLEAADSAAAQDTLQQMGVRATTLRPTHRTAFVAPLSLADLTFFNEQLATLTKAELPIESGLRQLASDVGSRKLKRLFLDLADDLAAGTPLPQALQRQQQRFPPQYPTVVAAGLKTGDLAGTLYGLTAHLRLKAGFRRVILEILAYPLVVLLLAFGVSAFLMRFVVPVLTQFLGDLIQESGGWGNAYTGGTAFVFTLVTIWPVMEALFAVLIVLLLLLFGITLLPGTRPLRERVLRHVPGVAQVYWSSVLARFTHTSALAAYTGTPLPDLVLASGEASGSPALAATSRRVAEKLTGGDSLGQAVTGERDVPALWTCAVEVAAPRGDLPGALAELARTYEVRAQQYVNAVRAVLGPVLFGLLAISIGSLVVSLLSVVNMFLQVMMSVMQQ